MKRARIIHNLKKVQLNLTGYKNLCGLFMMCSNNINYEVTILGKINGCVDICLLYDDFYSSDVNKSNDYVFLRLYANGDVLQLKNYIKPSYINDYLNNKYDKTQDTVMSIKWVWSFNTYEPTITFLLCMQKLKVLPKDIYKIIGKYIYKSKRDFKWLIND